MWSIWNAVLKLSDDLELHVDSAFPDVSSKFLFVADVTALPVVLCHSCGSVKMSCLSFSLTNLFFLNELEH